MKIRIDVRRFTSVQQAAIVAFAALLGALACVAFFFVVRGNHAAAAVVKFEADMAAYRQLSAVAFSEQAFVDWAGLQQGLDSEAVEALRWIFASASRTQRHVSPYLRITRRDLREVPDIERERKELRKGPELEEVLRSAQLLGIQLEFEARSEPAAVEQLELAARYLRDMALFNAAGNFVRGSMRHYAVEVERLQAERLKKDFEKAQLEQKIAELQRLGARYPESNRIAERQLLSIAGEGRTNHFLSPLLQVVGAESELVELRRVVARTERELEQARVASAFFVRALERLNSPSSAKGLLEEFESLLGAVAAEYQGESSDAARERLKEIGTTLTGLRVVFVDQPPFLSGDRVSTFRTMTFPRASAIGAVLGAAVALLVLFAPAFVEWLRADPREATA